MDWFDLLTVQEFSSLLQHHSSKASILQCSLFFIVQLSHPYMTTGKTIALTRQNFVGKIMTLILISCLGWSKVFFQGASVFWFHGCIHHLQWFWSPRKLSLTVSIISPPICHEVMGSDAMILVFWMLIFKPTFSLSSFTFIKRLFSSSSLSPQGWWHLHIWGCWYFSWQSWFQLVLHPAQHFT